MLDAAFIIGTGQRLRRRRVEWIQSRSHQCEVDERVRSDRDRWKATNPGAPSSKRILKVGSWVLGEPRVNVLEANLRLDDRYPGPGARSAKR